MIEFDCEEVKRQLNRLADALPEDRVHIWLKFDPAVGLSYTVYIHPRNEKSSEVLPSLCESGRNCEECVSALLSKAGSRDFQAKLRLKREAIEKARAELAKLESEIDPLVLAVDKAQAENNMPDDKKGT